MSPSTEMVRDQSSLSQMGDGEREAQADRDAHNAHRRKLYREDGGWRREKSKEWDRENAARKNAELREKRAALSAEARADLNAKAREAYKNRSQEQIDRKNMLRRARRESQYAEESAKNRAYYRANRDKFAARHKAWKAANKELFDAINRENVKRWAHDNPDARAALRGRYYARRGKATPKWLTNEQKRQMVSFYAEARRLTKETGIKHHVDHIYPINGVSSCGLHVPWNLQVLRSDANMQKGNKIIEPGAGRP